LFHDHKLSQWKISKLLHTDQSTIYRYIAGERGYYIDLSKYKDIDQEIKMLADRIVNNGIDEYELSREMIKLTLRALGKGYLCSIHRQLDNSSELTRCHICITLFKNI